MAREDLYKIIISRRTVRMFKQKKIPISLLKKAVNSARLAPSAANVQFLEYLVIDDKILKENVFSCVKMGGYVYPRRIPPKGLKPVVYIVVLINKDITKNPDLRDAGAACENILISLLCFGIASCWAANLDRDRLRRILNLPENYIIDSLIAAGYPAEEPKLEVKNDVRYWLDKNNRLHVPKRHFNHIFHRNAINAKKR